MTKNTEPRDTLRFWGVRGGIPSPGADTTRVGGNTTCIELLLAGQRIIIDGGSGLRELSRTDGNQPLWATMLFSHLHWDHIQGVPFCAALYNPRSHVRLVGPVGLRAALVGQMTAPTFPVGMDAMGADLSFETVSAGHRLSIGAVDVATAALRHPGGCLGFRLSTPATTVVYAGDVEHERDGIAPDLLALAEGADLLIYDAQYLPDEYPSRIGWGHSTYEAGAALAREAGVGRLVLTHHDPRRSDEAVAEVEQRARRLFPDTIAAREGAPIALETRVAGRHVPARSGAALPA